MLTTTTDPTHAIETTINVQHVKRRWDNLQSHGNRLDFDRAKLLHSVSARLQHDDKTLGAFIVDVLGEYRGKRVSAFIRLVHAFKDNRDTETWQQIGGRGAVLLSRLQRGQQRKIMVKVRATLRATKRATLSSETFRTIVRGVLGEQEYGKVLTERRSGQSNVRKELALLKQFLLAVVSSHADIKLPKQVRHALGLDLVAAT